VDIHVMLPAGQSPETYSPSPKMLASLSVAQVYFQIGVPFEVSWTDAIRSVNSAIRIAACCEQMAAPASATSTHDHQDLHIWSSPAQVKILAMQIRDELSLIDPAHGDDYQQGYLSFVAELDALDRQIQSSLANIRIRHFIVSHAAWGYFAEQYGLTQLALENNGKESGPRSLLGIIKLARDENIPTVFSIKQYQTPVVNSLARELKANVIELDPLAEDYLANMAQVSAHIAGALR
jgi:zinc transport system substrate-binding protein